MKADWVRLISAGSVLGGLITVPAVLGGAEGLWITARLMLCAAAGAFISGVVVRAGRHASGRTVRLERIVVENHKRASVWNYRLTKALGIVLPEAAPSDDHGESQSPRPRSGRRAQVLTGLTLAGIITLAVVAVFRDGDAWLSTAVTASAIGIVAAVTLVVSQVSARIGVRQARLESVVRENHRKASSWNYHLTRALGISVTERAGGRPTIVQWNATSSSRQREHSQARQLLNSGIFDLEYYSELVGAEFSRPVDAASHYLTYNAPKGLGPTPLLDPAFLPPEQQRRLMQGDVLSLVAHLRSAHATEPLSALFHPSEASIPLERASRHPGGVLGAFLSDVGADTLLPVPRGAVNAGTRFVDLRAALIRHVRETREAAQRMGSRTIEHWDAEAEADWIARAGVSNNALPSVTVIMPVKNRESLAIAAIRSVQAQTHGNWELIVVDDGSMDRTVERVADLASHDGRILLIRGLGRGVSNARNLGLERATGEYIAFLDSDNTWLPQYLELMLAAMVRNSLGAAYAVSELRTMTDVRYRAYEGGLGHLLLLNHIDLNVLTVRADVVRAAGLFDEGLRRWVDHDFVIRVAQIAEPEMLPFIGCRYDDSRQGFDRITVSETEHWQWVVLGKHWVDWTSSPECVSGRISVVIPTYDDSEMTLSAVRSVLIDADASSMDVEVIVIDNGSQVTIGQDLLGGTGVGGRVHYRRLPRNMNFAIGCNVGAAAASGEFVLFLNNDTEMRPGVLARLLSRMADPEVIGVQPLLVYGDETIQTAGTVFAARDSVPNHILVGHPAADAASLARVPFAALSAAALMMRVADVRRLRGFDPYFVNGLEDVDLCLRAKSSLRGHFEVVPDALVTHLESKSPGRGLRVAENRRLFLQRWQGRLPGPQPELYLAARFELAHVGSLSADQPVPRPLVVRDRTDGRLRWGIKISSQGGSKGDRWGDTHFAESLRTALDDQGHQAVVHRFGTHHSDAAAYDDVALVLRGRYRTRPAPGKVNILWVISHPEDISVDEVREFDLVYAASRAWSRRMSDKSGRSIIPLLQATDPARFNDAVEPVPSDTPLFVGSTHEGRRRPAVDLALAMGIPLRVYGSGWSGLLPAGNLAGTYIDNAELARYYRGASRVVADHWDAMAREGFIQNRVFDAVAAGARVVTDRVDGLHEVFGSAVRVYDTPDEFAYLCTAGSDDEFPGLAERRRAAARVRTEHSFEARAAQMTKDVAHFRKVVLGNSLGTRSQLTGVGNE